MKYITALPQQFIIYDTEYTSWEGSQDRRWSGDGEERELIQIGAIEVRDLEEVAAFAVLVKPVLNPQLSPFIQALTGITQDAVESSGIGFASAYEQFMQFIGTLPAYSYGQDSVILAKNIFIHQTGQHLEHQQFHDVRVLFAATGVNELLYQSGTIPAAFGLTPPPQAHDALNDARSVLMALRAVYTSG